MSALNHAPHSGRPAPGPPSPSQRVGHVLPSDEAQRRVGTQPPHRSQATPPSRCATTCGTFCHGAGSGASSPLAS
eukprot:3146514-Lingulodinium_polyedra.AAC.1